MKIYLMIHSDEIGYKGVHPLKVFPLHYQEPVLFAAILFALTPSDQAWEGMNQSNHFQIKSDKM